MMAAPVIPGRAYRVTGPDMDLVIRSASPCGALCVALAILAARGAA